MPTILIHSETHDSVESLKETVHAAVDTDRISTTLPDIHPDWSEGEPCPECGGERVSLITPFEEIYSSSDGEFDYRGHGDYTGDALSIMCVTCETMLMHKPFDKL